MKTTIVLSGLFLVLATMAPSAHATLLLPPLAPGGTSPVVPNTPQNNGGAPIGTKIAGKTETWNNGVGGTGSVEEVVYREDGTNGSTATGFLDFYIQVSVDSTSPDIVEHITASSFTGFTTLVGTASNVSLLGTGTVGPESIQRSGTGSIVGWNFAFPNEVDPGMTSLTLAIGTNATTYKTGVVSELDGATASQLDFFAPAAVPEPAGIVLFGTASALTAFFFRRRLARKA